jgi:hypothetical protein
MRAMDEVGDQAVPEERSLFSCLVVERHFSLLLPTTLASE